MNKKATNHMIRIECFILITLIVMTIGGWMNTSNDHKYIKAIDFTLTDQYGMVHTLSKYEGKVVFLSFWTSWCPSCEDELPYIEELFKEYGLNQKEIIFLGIVNPKSKQYLNNVDNSQEDITIYLKENGYTFPTLFDKTGQVFKQYGVRVYPVTFIINKKGNVYGSIAGSLTKEMMIYLIEKTRSVLE